MFPLNMLLLYPISSDMLCFHFHFCQIFKNFLFNFFFDPLVVQKCVNSYLFVSDKSKNKDLEKEYIASKELDDRIEGLIDAKNKDVFTKNGIESKEPDLEQIMVYLERSKNNESFTL